jgi:phospholipase D1/2
VSVSQEPWLGTEEEERDAIVSELLYIHSKIMIVDDRRVIIGSANLNDRSQNGDHDSEIAIVIEDTEMVEASMGGKKFMATKLAASWRRALMRGESCHTQGADMQSTSGCSPLSPLLGGRTSRRPT